MPKREVRRYLIVYHALGPMIAIGVVFLVLLLGASFFFAGEHGTRVREYGLMVLGASIVIGLIRSLVVIWKTRGLE